MVGRDKGLKVTQIQNISLVQKNGKYIVKSGTDFRTLSRLEVTFTDFGRTSVRVEKIDITSEIEEDPEVEEIVSDYQSKSSVLDGLWSVVDQED